MGSRGAQHGHSPFLLKAQMFQYLGSRGAQPAPDYAGRAASTFQYLGSRGAQPQCRMTLFAFGCFNTWAREEPNFICMMIIQWTEEFQYLGSRGAQRGLKIHPRSPVPVSILGLARSPTESVVFDEHGPGFNTWAREEPNHRDLYWLLYNDKFQYLGSRGAQQI